MSRASSERSAALGLNDLDRSAEELGHPLIASVPRPKRRPAYCGLGNTAIRGITQFSTACHLLPDNPGLRHATASRGLPWALMLNTFGVRMLELAQHQTHASGYFSIVCVVIAGGRSINSRACGPAARRPDSTCASLRRSVVRELPFGLFH